ncbi:DUF4198 domain-containing protein [Natroniella acetigena]|uniref:DUF4198 domain-containing protein n=1 Tax=Natroniella acetigena TaxID=52004 RepID=UPI00200A6583|nr:DUF4198 domain-containing protein [Natroniella acetigena]MCK8826675.1 DUF4198 domain-containing protein [Natroniella acetigena]
MFEKRRIIVLLSCIMLLFSSTTAFAHSAWIELPLTAELEEEIKFDTFWADPDDEIEERDLTELSLRLRKPNEEIDDVDLINRQTFFESNVEFEQEGEYTFFAVRPPARYRLSQYRDFAKSITWVGEDNGVHQPVGLTVEIVPLFSAEQMQSRDEIEVEVRYNGQPLPNAKIKLVQSIEPEGRNYPDLHNESEYETVIADNNGRADLTVDRNYNYILKARYEASASDVEDELDEDLSFFIRRVIFRSTLFLPAI